MKAHPLSQASLDPISNDRVSYFLGDRQPEPTSRARLGSLACDRQDMATMQLHTAGLDRDVVDALSQPHLLGDRRRRATRHGALALLLRDGDRDPLAALGAAATEDFTSATGFLTSAEPVGALATFIMRLVGTLGHGSTPPCGEGDRYSSRRMKSS